MRAAQAWQRVDDEIRRSILNVSRDEWPHLFALRSHGFGPGRLGLPDPDAPGFDWGLVDELKGACERALGSCEADDAIECFRALIAIEAVEEASIRP